MFTDMTPKQQCAEYNKYVNSTMGCPDPVLNADFESVGYEVRRNTNKVKLISLQMIGIMFGAMTFGQLSDMFGRRTVNYCLFHIEIIESIDNYDSSDLNRS
ncbi:unnamed protein product [Onchocerca flexuosa]|uniref:MFS domain-containing protein n=1 Tax=Onchocerca flexuosa TaxID=387005 RepID=A0A183HHD6_9BILA|nr:unnamed protein product [Onchocerca flexuosa]